MVLENPQFSSTFLVRSENCELQAPFCKATKNTVGSTLSPNEIEYEKRKTMYSVFEITHRMMEEREDQQVAI